eukprot:9287047-Alexandrium_andersonii.AAC.1
MSASLVGSEMCIRDSPSTTHFPEGAKEHSRVHDCALLDATPHLIASSPELVLEPAQAVLGTLDLALIPSEPHGDRSS